MIRFGPAASPRWFNQDLVQFRAYVQLITEAGGGAIEFVLYPGRGTEEIGRFHLLQPIWAEAMRIAWDSGLEIHAHAPLPAEFRLAEWGHDRSGFHTRITPILTGLALAESITGRPPVFVIHAAADAPNVTHSALTWMRARLTELGSSARIALELRAPVVPNDPRFDRRLSLLGEYVSSLDLPGLGICWDIAHDWEINGAISQLDPEMLAKIIHVHLHDSREGEFVHAPLDTGEIPWRGAIDQLQTAEWDGSITLEIRYRYANESGDAWSVLRSSLLLLERALTGE